MKKIYLSLMMAACVLLALPSQAKDAPAANAGADKSAKEGALVTLTGSCTGSSDCGSLDYEWRIPAGITLVSPYTPVCQIIKFNAPTVDANTDYVFYLKVKEHTATTWSAEDPVTVTVINNTKPTANAGPNQTVNEGATVTLNGSGSSDPQGDVITYKWTAPTGITFTGGKDDIVNPTFTAPEVQANTDYTFKLKVTDEAGLISDEATVKITVNNVNKQPIAVAQPDTIVNEGAQVFVRGNGSHDPDVNDVLTYQWSAPTGSGITLGTPTAVRSTFIAPEVQQNTMFLITLVVTDNHNLASKPAQVLVVVKNVNKPPTANAGTAQTVNERTVVTLHGSGSSDPDTGTTLTYLWTAPTGITLSSTTVADPTFTAPDVTADTPYTFTLKVSDGLEESSASVVITVKNVANAVEDLVENQPVILYPNPTNGKFTIKLAKEPDKGAEMFIIDTTGKVVYKQFITSKETAIDFKGQGKGIYFVNIRNQAKSETYKIILN